MYQVGTVGTRSDLDLQTTVGNQISSSTKPIDNEVNSCLIVKRTHVPIDMPNTDCGCDNKNKPS